MARGRLWTHDELLLALNLYYKIPFGQFHQHNPKVINLAKLMGRTSSSVAMQLSNFASLDPYHQSRGISGLRPPGKLAQQIWTEAQNDWENVVLRSESLLETLLEPQSPVEDKRAKEEIYKPLPKKQGGPTEIERTVKVRLGQRFFRDSVMANYHERCCICGLPITELLIASHIVPWKDREDLRLNPSNGLCLCALHDKAFDVGLLAIDNDYKVVISPSLHHHSAQEAVKNGLMIYGSQSISLPDRFMPERGFLEIHRNEYFIH